MSVKKMADPPVAKKAKFTLAQASVAGTPPPPPTTTFSWTIKDLTPASFTEADENESWDSPAFSACGVRWKVQVLPNRTLEQKKVLAIYLSLAQPNCTVQLGSLTFASTGVVARVYEKISSKIFSHSGKGAGIHFAWGMIDFLPHELLLRSPKTYFPSGAITFTVVLRARAYDAVKVPQAPKGHLISDLGQLLESGEGADVTFLAGDQSLRAHSLIVSMRSSTLKGLLRSVDESTKEHTITVPVEIQPEVFKQLLRYLYTEDIKLESAEHAQHMLHAADFYDVEPLRRLCEVELCNVLDTENVLNTLALAHQHSCPELRSYALRFAAVNAPAVLQLAEWSDFKRKHPELSDAVMHTMAHGEPPVAIAGALAPAAGDA